MDNSGIGKREKARLKEMQKMKKQKIQEILTAQNAAIDADMVCFPIGFVLSRLCSISVFGNAITYSPNGRTTRGRGA